MSDQRTALKRSEAAPPLARRGETADKPVLSEFTHEYLGFTLADENYGIPLRTVREILKLPPITEVPRSERDVLGIVSVRGRVTTVVDLRRRLKLVEGPVTKQTRVLLVENGEEIVGLLVDQVLQVFRLRDDEVEIAAVMGGDVAEYVLGIGRPEGLRRPVLEPYEPDLSKEGENLLILLDSQTLLRS